MRLKTLLGLNKNSVSYIESALKYLHRNTVRHIMSTDLSALQAMSESTEIPGHILTYTPTHTN
jgi:hypothetical protein